jgi:hypothetical protein
MGLTVVTANLSSTAYNDGNTSHTITANQTPNVGSSIIISVGLRGTGPTEAAVTSITDNQTGNNFVQIAESNNANQSDQELWWCPALATSSGTYTVTVNISSGCLGWILGLMEVSGGPVADQSGDSPGVIGGTTLTVTAGGANISPNDLVVAALMTTNNNSTLGLATPSSGYSSWYLFDPNQHGSGDAAYKILGGNETSSATWTWTTSTNAFAVIATFSPTALVVLPLLGTILM